MSDRFSGEITIGGKLPRAKAQTLCDAIRADCPCIDWGDRRLDDVTVDELSDLLDDEGRLQLVDDQASGGEFAAIENACEQLGLTFVRRSEAKYEYDAEIVFWTPKMGNGQPTCVLATQDGEPLVSQRDLNAVLRRMTHKGWPKAKQMLADLLAKIPNVPPLRLVGKGQSQ